LSNEWKKARHVGKTLAIRKEERSSVFWLYVVTEAGTDEPKFLRIQHPASHFREGEDIFATGFIVHEETWRERAG
jgi:hypothetical protein